MMTDMSWLRTLAARWRCHKTMWCCQYIDEPNCNSWNDPHRIARQRYRLQSRLEQRREARRDSAAAPAPQVEG